jgi:predicted DNA-binding protein (MmcQ/YjbR family)
MAARVRRVASCDSATLGRHASVAPAQQGFSLLDQVLLQARRALLTELLHGPLRRKFELVAASLVTSHSRIGSEWGAMTYEGFNAFCRALPATTYVVQWGGSHVWKVGGKVFAIGGWQIDEPSFTFKVSDIAYEMLKEQPGLRPAPYLASRGMKWIQHFAKPGLSDGAL